MDVGDGALLGQHALAYSIARLRRASCSTGACACSPRRRRRARHPAPARATTDRAVVRLLPARSSPASPISSAASSRALLWPLGDLGAAEAPAAAADPDCLSSTIDRRRRAARRGTRAHQFRFRLGMLVDFRAGHVRRCCSRASSTCRSCSTITTTRSPRRTASRSCRSCPTAASSSTATASCSRATTPRTRSRSRRARSTTSRHTIDELATLVEITARDRRRFKKLLEESKRFESLPIRTRLTDEEIARFAANRYRFPGVEVKARLFRQYPQGELFSHVIGHIGRINDADVKRIEPPTSHQLPRHRLHRQDRPRRQLRRRAARHHRHRAGRGRLGRPRGALARRARAPISGSNLVLKLDCELQEVAEDAFGDRRGALVAIEPATGGVLAFVSKPGFDPNLFVDGIDPQNWNELNNSPDKPMVNRALRGQYPPGSTFKPFMALAALDYGKRTPRGDLRPRVYSLFGDCASLPRRQGRRPRHRSTCTSRSWFRATRTTTGSRPTWGSIRSPASSTSSGSAAAPASTSRASSSGAQPVAGMEAAPLQAEVVRRRDDQHRHRPGLHAHTPLQLAVATATLANDGVMVRPHLVKYVEDVQDPGDAPDPARRTAQALTVKPEHLAIDARMRWST